MYQYCDRYASTVCRFEQIGLTGKEAITSGEKAEIEQLRTSTHDATIASINLLVRSLKKAGHNTDWVERVSSAGRAGYMAFAISTAFEKAGQSTLKKNE